MKEQEFLSELPELQVLARREANTVIGASCTRQRRSSSADQAWDVAHVRVARSDRFQVALLRQKPQEAAQNRKFLVQAIQWRPELQPLSAQYVIEALNKRKMETPQKETIFEVLISQIFVNQLRVSCFTKKISGTNKINLILKLNSVFSFSTDSFFSK